MSIPGLSHVTGFIRHIAPKAIILLYHRVSEETWDPQLLCVSPAHFAEHMQILRNYFNPTSLINLRCRMRLNAWPSRSVVITFDDGYADNCHHALALLAENDIPATIFVTSGILNTPRAFWWDELEKLILSNPNLPPYLELRIGNRDYFWEFSSISPGEIHNPWHVLSETPLTTRQKAYHVLLKHMHQLPPTEQQDILAKLAEWGGYGDENEQITPRTMSADELVLLSKSKLVDIGAHTVNHPCLAALPVAQQKAEISESKATLEQIINQPVRTFAYPYGTRNDYTKDTVKLVRKAGFQCACSNYTGQINLFSDPYQLPRFIVRDWDGETFEKKLMNWFKE